MNLCQVRLEQNPGAIQGRPLDDVAVVGPVIGTVCVLSGVCGTPCFVKYAHAAELAVVERNVEL